MRYLSVCSGIEAASVAWGPLSWEPVAFAEIEPFPAALLEHRYPGVPNWGDITKFAEWPDAAIDVLVGGTPCQSFSVAGLRKGLADPRGNLALAYLAIADRYRPEWLVWENVPGVLSSNRGWDFGSFLGGLGHLGYGYAYRVLDAQYVRVDGYPRAVPQRRRRVFVVGNLRDWRRAAAVLFERESLSGNSPPRREARQGVAQPTGAGSPRGSGYRNDADTETFVAHTLSAACGKASANAADLETYIAHSLRADGFDASEDGTGRGTPIVPVIAGRRQEDDDNLIASQYREAMDTGVWPRSSAIAFNGRMDPVPGPVPGALDEDQNTACVAFDTYNQTVSSDGSTQTLCSRGDTPGGNAHLVPAVAFAENPRAEVLESDVMRSLVDGGGKPGQGYPAIRQGWAVRRLTPTECERLQGLPPGYTAIPYRGKPAADGPRYKAIGNSMAVNVMRWLGQRVDLVRSIIDEAA